jgi:hypothetical protein
LVAASTAACLWIAATGVADERKEIANLRAAVAEVAAFLHLKAAKVDTSTIPLSQGYAWMSEFTHMSGESVDVVIAWSGGRGVVRNYRTHFPDVATSMGFTPASIDTKELLVAFLEAVGCSGQDRAVLATAGSSPDVRAAATSGLTDQALLARIALEDNDDGVRMSAVEELRDQGLLARIAVEAKEPQLHLVRRWAVGKLTDQASLTRIALEDKDADIRETAIRELTDENSLAKVALKANETRDRCSAVGRLTDQALLAKIAAEDKDAPVRRAATGRLTN